MGELLKNGIDFLFEPKLYFFGSVAILAAVLYWRKFFSSNLMIIGSLMQVPLLQGLLPRGRRVGVLTISKASLTPEHLTASGVAADTPIVGTDEGREFSRAILDDEPRMDVELARADLIEAGDRLIKDFPETGAIVLECTNMVPYAADLRQNLGLPVYSIYSFVTWFQSGLMPRVFDPRLLDQRVD